jgi:hypothetical protein
MKNKSLQKSRNNHSSTDSKSSSSFSFGEQNIQQGGGIKELIFGKNTGKYVTQLILDSFNSGFLQTAIYVLEHSIDNEVDIKFGAKDSNGKTILHWVTICAAKVPQLKNMLVNILKNDSAVNNINIQDNDKNTIAHYAMKCNMMDMLNFLVRKGIDLTLKNNDGLSIQLKKEYVKQPSVFRKPQSQAYTDISTDEVGRIREKLGNLVDSFVQRTDKDSDSDLDFTNTVSVTSMPKSKPQSIDVASPLNNTNRNVLDDLMKHLDGVVNNDENETDDVYEVVDGLVDEFNKNNESDSFVDKLMNVYSNKTAESMAGGSNIMKGTRRMNTYSEISMSGGDDLSTSTSSSSSSCDEFDDCTSTESTESDDEDDDHFSGKAISRGNLLMGLSSSEVNELLGLARLSRLSREKNEGADKHEAAVNRIMELLNVGRFDARAYKAILYKQIRDGNPDLNNVDRSIELLKRASDDKILESVSKGDVEKMKSILMKLDEERDSKSQSSSDKKPQKAKKAKESSDEDKKAKKSAPKKASVKKTPAKKTKGGHSSSSSLNLYSSD